MSRRGNRHSYGVSILVMVGWSPRVGHGAAGLRRQRNDGLTDTHKRHQRAWASSSTRLRRQGLPRTYVRHLLCSGSRVRILLGAPIKTPGQRPNPPQVVDPHEVFRRFRARCVPVSLGLQVSAVFEAGPTRLVSGSAG
jgi:hypothetical protein